MPFTVSASPAPLTFTIWPNWKKILYRSLGWIVFVAFVAKEHISTWVLSMGTVMGLFALVRRDRIEIYPDSITFRQYYFGIPRTQTIRPEDSLGVEWHEGNDDGREKTPSYLEFYTTSGSIKAGYTSSFEEYELFREQVRMMYPELEKSWNSSSVRSKHLTLLNLN